MITPEQIRAARALLGWQQADLAKKAGISVTGLSNIEMGRTDPKASTLSAIEDALAASGIDFVNDKGGRMGVILARIAPVG